MAGGMHLGDIPVGTNFTARLARLPKPVLAGFGLVMLLLVALIDTNTSPEVSLAVFYLLPVSFFTWFIGARTGTLSAVASALLMFWVNRGEHNFRGSVSAWNSAAALILYLIFVLVLSELKALYELELYHSREDYLTGVANARAFYEALDMEKHRALRFRYPLTVVFLDLDDFKRINDRWGHLVGNAVLTTVAHTIQDNLRRTDTVARWGGDEFALLLPQEKYDTAIHVLNKIRSALAEIMHDQEWKVTFSVGAATFAEPPDSTEEMLHKADALMYRAKGAGKNLIMREQYGNQAAAI